MMKQWVGFLIVAGMVVLLEGCASKPKLNLVNLAPLHGEGGEISGVEGDAFNAEPNFKAATPDSTQIGQEQPVNTGDWSSSEAELDGVGFLQNPREWKARIYFALNRHTLSAEGRRVADELVSYLQENPQECVVIEGHTDERGSEEYNRTLGEHRALNIKEYLENSGVATDRIFTISYGEDRPAVQDAQGEEQWRLNRRAQFLVGKRK